MKRIKLKLTKSSYEIVVGNNSLNQLPKILNRLFKIKNAIIITNPTIKRIYSRKINQIFKDTKYSLKYIIVPDSETSKSFRYFSSTVSEVSKVSNNKPLFIIAWGGGVVGDLAGFVACVYKRGVPYIQVPTTLLGQVDSAIGGKTAIDLTEGKNLVGVFYQPCLVLSDTQFLKSLAKRQIRSGLAEVIKYGIIMDPKLFEYISRNYKKILALKEKYIEHIVYRSSLHKAQIIEKDERETKGIRTILNFGHTIGHAIESASGYKRYTHGEAVSIGMACAADISRKLGLLNKNSLNRINSLLNRVGLPTKIVKVKSSKILEALAFDKKFIHGYTRLVLIKGIGKAIIKEKINPKIIREVIKDATIS